MSSEKQQITKKITKQLEEQFEEQANLMSKQELIDFYVETMVADESKEEDTNEVWSVDKGKWISTD
jgi:hypothetical protein